MILLHYKSFHRKWSKITFLLQLSLFGTQCYLYEKLTFYWVSNNFLHRETVNEIKDKFSNLKTYNYFLFAMTYGWGTAIGTGTFTSRLIIIKIKINITQNNIIDQDSDSFAFACLNFEFLIKWR